MSGDQPIAERARAIQAAGRIVEVSFWIAVAAIAMAWLRYASWSTGALIAAVLLAVAIVATIRKGMLMAIDKVEASHRAAAMDSAAAPTCLFYRVNSVKIGLAELWALGDASGFLKGAMLKLLWIPMPHLYFSDPAAIDLTPAVATGSGLQAMLEESIRVGRDAGLVEQFTFRVPQLTATDSIAALFVTPDRRVLAVANAVRATVGQHTSSGLKFMCWSRLAGGDHVATTNAPGLAPPPTWIDRETLRASSMRDVLKRHLDRIAQRDVVSFPGEKAGILNEYLRMNRKATEYLVDRGVLEPMADEEIAAIRKRLQPA